MKLNLIGPFVVNAPFGTEIAFAKGLRRIGHEVIEVDPNVDKTMEGLDLRSDATVVFKTCCGAEQSLTRLNGPVVVYQPDDARFPHIQKMIAMMRRYSDLLLSFDDHGAKVALGMGYRAAETLLLTADDELYCPAANEIERDIDVSFIASAGDPVAHASRRKMVKIVNDFGTSKGWNMVFGTTQDIPQILDVYRRSKVVLNHATDVGQEFGTGYGLQCRHFEVGMTETCLLSNSLLNLIEGAPSFRTFSSEEELIGQLCRLLTSNVVSYPGGIRFSNPMWKVEGQTLYSDVVWKHKPEYRAKQLVDFIQRNS